MERKVHSQGLENWKNIKEGEEEKLRKRDEKKQNWKKSRKEKDENIEAIVKVCQGKSIREEENKAFKYRKVYKYVLKCG